MRVIASPSRLRPATTCGDPVPASSSTIAPRSTGTASKITSSTRSNSSGSGRRPSNDELARLSSWKPRVWRGRSTTSTTRLVMRERSSSILYDSAPSSATLSLLLSGVCSVKTSLLSPTAMRAPSCSRRSPTTRSPFR